MSKSRKDQFEEQLKDLQKDISKLSQKLTTPLLSDASVSKLDANNLSTLSVISDARSHRSVGSISHLDGHDASKTLEKLRIELHHSNKERDDATYKLEQARLEIEHLKKGIQETARLRSALDHLKQDHDSLRISLESSERIRKQQKDLINLLQRSHAITTAAGGIVHPVDVNPGHAENSLVSHHASYQPGHHDQSVLSHHNHSHRSEPQYHSEQYRQHNQQQPQQQQQSQQTPMKLKTRRIKTSGSVSSASHRATTSGSVASGASGGRSGANKTRPPSGKRVTSGSSVGTSTSKKSNGSNKGTKGGAAPAAHDLSYSTAGESSYQEILQANRSLVPPSSALQPGSVLSYNPPAPHHHYGGGGGGGGGGSTILTMDNMSYISALGNGSTSRVLFDSHSAPSSRATSRSNSFDLSHHLAANGGTAAPPSSSSASRPSAGAFTFSDSSIEGGGGSAHPHYPPPQPHPLPQYQSPYRFQSTSAPTPPRPPTASEAAAAHPTGSHYSTSSSTTGKPPRYPPSSSKKGPPAPLFISTAADRAHLSQAPQSYRHTQATPPTSPRHSPRKSSATPTKSSLKKVLIQSPRSLPTYEQYQSLTSHTSGLLSPTRKVKKIRAFSAPHSSVLVGGGHTTSSAARIGRGGGAAGGSDNGGGGSGSPSRLFNVPIPSPATTFGHSDRKLH